MAKESDERILRLLRDCFSDRASNVPDFTRTAETGGHRSDEGLCNLFRPHWSVQARREALKQAIAEFLSSGGRPAREEARGDAEMRLDAAVYYQFRVEVAGTRLFVKVFLDDDYREPCVTVISVKRDYGKG